MIARVTEFEVGRVLPSDQTVLGHQGFPSGEVPSERTTRMVERAKALFLDLAEPRAVVQPIEVSDFAVVYMGEGNNDEDDPLAEIFPRASHLSLFAATVGQTISDEIHRLLERGDLAEGSLLDSVASEAADQTAELIEQDLKRALRERQRISADHGVMRFSPGYCGWHISGQRKLFDRLKPEAIGISLNERYLMEPLKSVSGVIIGGEKEIFVFKNNFLFCVDCRNPSCQNRIKTMMEQ